jgi:hypothetical protein
VLGIVVAGDGASQALQISKATLATSANGRGIS